MFPVLSRRACSLDRMRAEGRRYGKLLEPRRLATSLTLIFSLLLGFNASVAADTVGALYDDFTGSTYTLRDGGMSPNGLWLNVWNGFGSSGVEYVNGNYVFFEEPRAPRGGNSHSVLVVGTQKFQDHEISLDVKTVKQLRTRQNPRPWEVAWLLFRYTDTSHYYYFILKTNGVELGKKDGSSAQVFLYTANQPTLQIGSWSHWHIRVVGNHITISVNGVQVIDFYDQGMSPQLSKGALGLYCEDSRVNFDNVYVAQL